MCALSLKKQRPQDIDLVFSTYQTKNSGSIYISNIKAARNLETLKKLNIKAVISVVKGGYLPHPESQLPNYLYLPADDNESFNIALYFQKTYSFIESNLKRTNVLVHCAAGISRSASIVIAFIMRYSSVRFSEAMGKVFVKRPSICPNPGFMDQLRVYQSELKAQQKQFYHEKNAKITINNANIGQEIKEQEVNNKHEGSAPEVTVKRLLTLSSAKLDNNIQRFKERCEQREVSHRYAKYSRRTAYSMGRKNSAPNVKQLYTTTSKARDIPIKHNQQNESASQRRTTYTKTLQ